jgi:hypothetical protein
MDVSTFPGFSGPSLSFRSALARGGQKASSAMAGALPSRRILGWKAPSPRVAWIGVRLDRRRREGGGGRARSATGVIFIPREEFARVSAAGVDKLGFFHGSPVNISA